MGNDFFQEYGKIYLPMESGTAPSLWHVTAPEDLQNAAERVLAESWVENFGFRDLVMAMLVMGDEKFADCPYSISRLTQSREVLDADVGKKLFCIDDERFLSRLTESDLRKICGEHHALKGAFLETMIDIFEHPESHIVEWTDRTFRSLVSQG